MGSENLWAGYQKNSFSTLLRVLIIQFSRRVFPISSIPFPSIHYHLKTKTEQNPVEISIARTRTKSSRQRRDETHVMIANTRFQEKKRQKRNKPKLKKHEVRLDTQLWGRIAEKEAPKSRIEWRNERTMSSTHKSAVHITQF